jgi:hypothetical protein
LAKAAWARTTVNLASMYFNTSSLY